MFSHVVLGTNGFDRALGFYRPLMDLLEFRERFCDPTVPWAGWETAPGLRPLFVIGRPWDHGMASAGNGPVVAFLAARRRTVDLAHALALRCGGSDEGAPGLRPHYHADYYGAYFRDLDGNKLCVVCHAPGESAVAGLALAGGEADQRETGTAAPVSVCAST